MVNVVGESERAGGRGEEQPVLCFGFQMVVGNHAPDLKECCRDHDTSMSESTIDKESVLGKLKMLLNVEDFGVRIIDCAAMFGGSIREEGLRDLDCEVSEPSFSKI